MVQFEVLHRLPNLTENIWRKLKDISAVGYITSINNEDENNTPNILIIIIMSCCQHGYPWPSLATSPYRSSLLAGLQGYIPYPHIATVCMFKLVVLFLLGHIRGSILSDENCQASSQKFWRIMITITPWALLWFCFQFRFGFFFNDISTFVG